MCEICVVNHPCGEKGKFQRCPRISYHFSIFFPPFIFVKSNWEHGMNRMELCAKRSWPPTTSARGIWASTLGRCSTGSRRRCRWCCWPRWGKIHVTGLQNWLEIWKLGKRGSSTIGLRSKLCCSGWSTIDGCPKKIKTRKCVSNWNVSNSK